MEEITKHFSHRHPLICCDEITQEVVCPGCRLPVSSGPAYICAENYSPCKYFSIHKSCAELPEQIFNHPFHQHHPPLILKKNSRYRKFICSLCHDKCFGFKFSCSDDSCSFELDAACASLRPYSTHDEENDQVGIIKYFSHEHPLISVTFPEGKRNLMNCKCCDTPIKGGLMIYACLECRFFIHKSCTKLPKHIKRHPFHPQHDLYLKIDEYMSYIYSCFYCWWSCSDIVGLMLMRLGNEEEKEEQRIECFSHEHPLTQLIRCLDDEEKDMVANKIICIVCSLSLINDTECTVDGSMKCYVCFDCKRFFHKSCAELPREIPSPPFHPSGSLTLKPGPLLKSCDTCGFCGGPLIGYIYQFSYHGFALHVTCAMLIPTISNKQIECQIQHRRHKHALIPFPVLDRQKINFARLVCFGCESTLSDSSYVCCECRFFLCKLCAEEFSEEILQHPFHPQHPLTFFEDSTTTTSSTGKPYCNACGEMHSGFVYHCASCQFYLGLKCASLPTVKCELHEHPLTFFNHNSIFLCQNCSKPFRESFLRCVLCRLNLHVQCIPALPTIAKAKTHRHLLTLTDPHPEKGRKGYCDACEKERNPNLFVYYCDECDFVAHVECALSQEEEEGEEVSSKEEDSSEEEEDSSGEEQSLVVRQIWDAGFGVFPYHYSSNYDFLRYLGSTSDHQEEDDDDNDYVSVSSFQLDNAIKKHTRILNKLLQQRARREAFKITSPVS